MHPDTIVVGRNLIPNWVKLQPVVGTKLSKHALS